LARKGLDKRLSTAFLRILEIRDPDWVHQEEIYQYVEENVKLTEKQRELHVQKAGQIEENWQHDLRNLQHSLKRNGTAINPDREIWGLPLAESDVSEIFRYWTNAVQFAYRQTTNESLSITAHDGEIIRRDLFLERIQHLILCGGILPVGRLHNWSKIENGIIEISPDLSVDSEWITLKFTEDSRPQGFSTVEFQEKTSLAAYNGQRAIDERKKGGIERRTVSMEIRPRPNFTTGSSSIPYVIDSNGNQITLQSPNLIYRKEGHASRGYRCPMCNFKTLARRGTWNDDCFAHFPNTKDYLKENGITCPWYKGGSSSRVSGNDERSLQILLGMLSLRLRRGNRLSGPSLVTDGGSSGLGFPIDLTRPIRKIIEYSNLEEKATMMLKRTQEPAPIGILDLNCDSSITFTRKNLRVPDTLKAPKISEKDCFLIETTYNDEFQSSGRGLLRIRPGIDFLDNDKVLTGYQHREIGIVTRVDFPLPKRTLLRFDLPDSDLRLVVFDCNDEEHIHVMNQLNVRIDPSQNRTHEFEVLIHSPMRANPMGKSNVYLNNDESLGLVIRNQFQDEDQMINQEMALKWYSKRNQYSSRQQHEKKTTEPITETGWAVASVNFDEVGYHSKVLVDGSFNWDEQFIKPRGGLDVYGPNVSDPKTNFNVKFCLEIERYDGKVTHLDLMATELLKTIELSYLPDDIRFSQDLKTYATEDQRILTTIVNTSGGEKIYRDFKIGEICKGLSFLRENGHDITSFELRFNAESDWINHVGFPTIQFNLPPSEDLLRLEKEIDARMERLSLLKEYLADTENCKPPESNLLSHHMDENSEQGRTIKDSYLQRVRELKETVEDLLKKLDKLNLYNTHGRTRYERLVIILKEVYHVQSSSPSNSIPLKLEELELMILEDILKYLPGDIDLEAYKSNKAMNSGSEMIAEIAKLAGLIDQALGKKMPTILKDLTRKAQRKMLKGNQRRRLNCLFNHGGLSPAMKEFLLSRIGSFKVTRFTGCELCNDK